MPLDSIVVGLVPGDRKGDTIRNAAVIGNANVTWVATGTRMGALSQLFKEGNI